MTLTKEFLTNVIIEWLNKHEYSRNHWTLVAQEMMDKANQDKTEAIRLLAEALEHFHHLYKSEVVKSNNLLNDLLGCCLELVDWEAVAKTRYP